MVVISAQNKSTEGNRIELILHGALCTNHLKHGFQSVDQRFLNLFV